MRILFIVLLMCSCFSYADESGTADIYVGVGGFGEDSGHRSGAQISVVVLDDSGVGFHAGGMIYDSNPNTDDTDIFTGYYATGILHIDSPFGLYVGAGVFAGEDEECDAGTEENSQADDEHECTYSYVISFYPEFGIALSYDKIQVTPYIRRFFDSDNDYEPFNVYGINFSYKIR